MSSKFKEVLDDYFPSKDPVYYIFLETLDKIQFNDNDYSLHDPHPEGQEDQEYPPSSSRFLIATFPLIQHSNCYQYSSMAKERQCQDWCQGQLLGRCQSQHWGWCQCWCQGWGQCQGWGWGWCLYQC